MLWARPLNGATGVGVGVTPTAPFNEPIQAGSINATFVTGTTAVPFPTSYNPLTFTVTVKPSSALAHPTKYALKETALSTPTTAARWSAALWMPTAWSTASGSSEAC